MALGAAKPVFVPVQCTGARGGRNVSSCPVPCCPTLDPSRALLGLFPISMQMRASYLVNVRPGKGVLVSFRVLSEPGPWILTLFVPRSLPFRGVYRNGSSLNLSFHLKPQVFVCLW